MIYNLTMGVVRPPWISKDCFTQCPFNYCDHFGNQEILATVCKICKDDIQRKKLYEKAGKDPNDWENAFEEIAESFAQMHKRLALEAKRLGIDLSNLPDEEDTTPEPETYPIFLLIKEYGDSVEKTIHKLSEIPAAANTELLLRVTDVLAHSRFYILAKTTRALHSQHDEKTDEISKELADSKTSALFAYIAIERNSRALLALANHKPLSHLRKKHLELAKISLSIIQTLQETFFPEDILDYKEFGTEDYDACFEKYSK